MAEAKESLSQLTLIAVEAALLAGGHLAAGFGTPFSVSSKEGRHNLVTEYDHLSEKLIIDFLKKEAPHSRFLAEEGGATGNEKEELLWIIDPLDGTVNFAHHIPMFAVSIAAQVKGVVKSAVIYQPITHELFVAEKGRGAFLNGERLKISKVAHLADAIVATGFPYNLAENPNHCIEHFIDLLKVGIPIRRIGAATLDLSYTAAGRFDAFFEVKLAPWDVAAGKLIVEEAGGQVSRWDGSPFDIHSYLPIFASNGSIHKELSSILSREVQR